MEKAPGVLIASQRVQRSVPAPRLRLLIELEPRHRVFFRNLADLLVSRPVPRIPLTSRPAPFWNDVFVPSGAPWSSFLESMLWHLLLLILFVWGQSRVWVKVETLPQRDAFHRPITYYPPTRSFPAAEGRAPNVRARSRVKRTSAHQPAHQPAIPVTPERKPSIVTPPDIKQATAALPNFPDSRAVTPIVPFSALAGPRRSALAGPSGAVAPPPQLDQATARRLALPQASAVAPAPELGGPSPGRAMKAPNTGGLRVVPPPPSVQNAGNSARAGSGLRSLSGAGPNVVPPPPSVQGAGKADRDARLGSMAGAASQVVPPPPSVQGSGKAAGDARLGSMAGAASQVVPPPPSVQGSGGPVAGTRLGSLSGAGSQVVPPPPSVEGAGNPGASGRLGSLSGNGSQIVPPPPSVEGTGNSGAGGRLGSLSGNGSQIVPPPPSFEGTGNSGASGPSKAMDPQPVVASASSPTPAGNNETQPTMEELPLGLIGVVFAAPGTSFFSNFEVFVAKRRIGKDKDQLQLIKLVYEFLPYQRRLSEYDLNNVSPRVIKLRVTPDPSCDESLGHMIQSHTDTDPDTDHDTDTDPTGPATKDPKLPPALRSSDLNAVLPCYRTTAGDFQKAMSRAH